MKKLIINADDFGISKSVNTAIHNCFLRGVLDSATLMVNMPFAQDAAKISCIDKIPVGLHFNLTLGKPISSLDKVNTLVDENGQFYSRKKFIKKYLLKKISIDQIEIEFNAQLYTYLEMGLKLDHIDSHQHIHIIPKIFNLVASYCESKDVPLRMVKNIVSKNHGLKKKLKVGVLSYFANHNFKVWHKRIIMNPYLISIFDMLSSDKNLTLDMYKDLLLCIPDEVTEFMIHPIIPNSEICEKELTRISHISEQEYQILMSQEYLDFLNQLKFKRIVYSDLIL